MRIKGSQTGNKTAETAKKAQEAYQQMKEQQIKPDEKKPELADSAAAEIA